MLRLQDLSGTGLSIGELAATGLANVPARQFLPALRAQSGATPLPYGLLRLSTLYGLREEPVRLPAALAGVAAVAASMLLLRDLFGARAALASCLVLAASPLHMETSRQALAPSLSSAGAIAFSFCLWRLLRGDRISARAALVGAAALYAGYAALIVLAAALATAALGRLTRRVTSAAARRLMVTCLGALVLFAPWAAYDLPTEPGPQFVPPNVGWYLLPRLANAPLKGETTDPAPRASAGLAPSAAVLLALALLGGYAAWRRRPLAGFFAGALVLLGLAATLATAWLAPYVFSASQLLFALPLYLGVAALGFEGIIRWIPWRASWTPLCLAFAALLAWTAERPALALPDAVPLQDWRGAFDVVLRNLGRDDVVSVPEGRDALQFYGLELERRLPPKDRLSGSFSWTLGAERAWLIAGWRARLHTQWRELRAQLQDQRFVVDLSPADDPAVLFLGMERKKTYLTACHFELPAQVVARQTILRDCLRELGPMKGPLRQVRTLIDTPGVTLRNPSLLESVKLLSEAGITDEARALVDTIVAREPDWTEAQEARSMFQAPGSKF